MQPRAPSTWRRALPHAGALLFCFALAVVTTYPLLTQLGTHLAGTGDAPADAVCFAWNNWWIHHALVDLHAKPYFTDHLLVPFRLDLRLHTLGLLYGLASAPFLPLLGPIAIVNLQILLTPVLNGYAVFLLARRWVGREDVAILCGAALSMSPAIDFHLSMGRPSCAAIWPVALALLFLARLVEERDARGRWWSCLGLAASLITLLLADQQMVIFGGLVLALYVVTVAVSRPRAIWDRRLLLHALVVFALVAYPFRLLCVRPFFQTPGYTVPDPSEALSYSVPPWMTINPADVWRLYGTLLPLGLVAAIAVVRRERRAAFGITCALVCAWLTMGPVVAGTRVPMLFGLLQHLPGFSQFRTPYRFQIPAAFGLTLALAASLTHVRERLERGRPGRPALGRLLMAGLALLIALDAVAERSAHGFVTHLVPDEPIYRAVGAARGDFVVLEIPFGVRSGTEVFGRGDDLMLHQTVHGKRMFNGYLTRIPYAAMDYYQRSPAFRFLADEPFASPDIAAEVAAVMREHRVGFVVVHPRLLGADRLAAVMAILRALPDLEAVPTGTDALAFRVRPATAPRPTPP